MAVKEKRAAAEITNAIYDALRVKFCERNGYVLVEELEPSGLFRRFDALAVGLWPSRGCLLIGVEVKATLEDLYRELSMPAKADGLYRRCDLWYLAVPKELEDEALAKAPEPWGIYVLRGTKTLRELRKAQRHEAIVDRFLLSSVLRRREASDSAALARQLAERYSDGYKARQEEEGRQLADAQSAREELSREVAAFEHASGLTLQRWGSAVVGEGQKLGQAVRALQNGAVDGALEGVRRTERELGKCLRELGRAREVLERAKEQPQVLPVSPRVASARAALEALGEVEARE